MRGDLSELVELLAAPIHHSSAQHPALVDQCTLFTVHWISMTVMWDLYICVFGCAHSSQFHSTVCFSSVQSLYFALCPCCKYVCVCWGVVLVVLGDQEIFSRHPSAALFVLPVHCIQCGTIVTFTKNSVKYNCTELHCINIAA